MNLADAMGLISRPIRLEVEDLSDVKRPAILHWNLDHFVVLVAAKGHRILIHDPARGRRWIDGPEISRSFSGVAVEFSPSHDLQPKKAVEAISLTQMFGAVRGLVPSIVQMFTLALVMQVFALSSPILNQLVIDDAITKGDMGLLNVLAIAMLLLAITTAGIRLLQGLVGLYMTTQMSFQMRTNLLRYVLRLPVAWFEKRHVGDILSRFDSMGPVQSVLLNAVPVSVLNAIIAITTAIMMIVYSPLLSSIEVASIFVFIGIRAAVFPYFKRKTQENLYLSAKVQTTFLETIRGARSFKLFGYERERVAIWQNQQTALINNQVLLSRFSLFGSTGTMILASIQQIVVWFLGARMVIDSKISLGMLFAFQAYTGQFGGAVFTLIEQFFSLRTMRIHLERLSEITHAVAEPGIDVPADPARPSIRRISMDKVGFRYGENDPWIFRDVSFVIEPGEFVCLRGPSGHGKSSLLKLLLGFEEPNEGQVMVNGEEMRKFGIRTFRDQVGAVLQDDTLFSGTIGDNISFFDTQADDERIVRAARAAYIHDDIEALPMKYHTLTGDLGSTLSAGQRQRVLLARALYRDPAILILDEGTANLDPEKEDAVMRAVEALPITRIVVAHRERAARHATRYLTVKGGSLTEE